MRLVSAESNSGGESKSATDNNTKAHTALIPSFKLWGFYAMPLFPIHLKQDAVTTEFFHLVNQNVMQTRTV